MRVEEWCARAPLSRSTHTCGYVDVLRVLMYLCIDPQLGSTNRSLLFAATPLRGNFIPLTNEQKSLSTVLACTYTKLNLSLWLVFRRGKSTKCARNDSVFGVGSGYVEALRKPYSCWRATGTGWALTEPNCTVKGLRK